VCNTAFENNTGKSKPKLIEEKKMVFSSPALKKQESSKLEFSKNFKSIDVVKINSTCNNKRKVETTLNLDKDVQRRNNHHTTSKLINLI
jgi:hypothetical protein